MYYYISGKLALLEAGTAVIDAGGVGYRLTISDTTYDAMPPCRGVKEPPFVKLFTHLAVREDGIELFGFATETELSTFRMLISVSGVGPKAAISVLSSMTPEKFALAVCTDDKKTISKANGIGPKTAARMILELKDKLMKEHGNDLQELPAQTVTGRSTGGKSKLAEATDALLVLGYSHQDAAAVLNDPVFSEMELEEIIRCALKKLMRN